MPPESLPLLLFMPQSLPVLPWEDRRQLPAQAALYFVLDEDGTILYIGRSVNLAGRFLPHHRQHQFAAHDVKIAWFLCEDIGLLHTIERALIAHFAPPFNATPIPVRPGQKVFFSMRMDPALFEELSRLAIVEDRPLSRQVERLLKVALAAETSPGHPCGKETPHVPLSLNPARPAAP